MITKILLGADQVAPARCVTFSVAASPSPRPKISVLKKIIFFFSSEIEETVDANGTLIDQQPTYNKIVNAKVQLHHQDHIITGKVKRRTLGPNGKTSGSYHDNSMLNSTIYEMEFPDREVKKYAANMIAENILTQVDYEGFTTTIMEGITDHDRDEKNDVHIRDKCVKTYSNQKRLR
eukprot:15325708-Ditylum_brightwellii.AAC.1